MQWGGVPTSLNNPALWLWAMTLQEDAAQLSELARRAATEYRHPSRTIVAADEVVDLMIDVDIIATRITVAADMLRLGFITRLDFPAADAKVVRVAPEEDRWMIRRGAYTDNNQWVWDITNGAWLAVPSGAADDTLFLFATVCTLAQALEVVGRMEAASGANR